MPWNDPKWGQEILFAANPDFADILGDMDFDFENFHFGARVGLPRKQNMPADLPDFQPTLRDTITLVPRSWH